MAGGPNTIDYSNLNKSLQPKRKIEGITTDVAQKIWEVFLKWTSRKDTQTDRLDTLSGQINNWSEAMKIKLVLTIDHLSKEGLLKPEAIKSLPSDQIRRIAWSKEEEKIQNIINYLVDDWRNKGEWLTVEQKEKLNQAVIDWLDKHYSNLAEKEDINEQLQAKNEELEEELNASEKANEVVEASVLTRRSRSNTIRVWKSIENINVNKKWLDPATKARKVLWQANNFAVFGSWKRFDWVNKLPRKFDIKEEYNRVVEKLSKKMDNTKKPKEKIAIRYIMRQVNKAYTDYIEAISIDEETRRGNMKNINQKMAA